MTKMTQQARLGVLAAGVNDVIPARELLEPIVGAEALPAFFGWCRERGVEGIVAAALERANKEYSVEGRDFIDAELMEPWIKARAGIIQRVTLLDVERAEIFRWMDEQGIWYVPLKGIVLKELYPRMGMRDMTDNDILFDDTYAAELNKFMTERGYRGLHIGAGHDDNYLKEPVYNYEMHRSSANRGLTEMLDDEHRLSDEAFYVHMIEHAHHHYTLGGIGIRILADIYLYNKAKTNLDGALVSRLLGARGLEDFGRQIKNLAEKLLGVDVVNNGMPELNKKEMDMLEYMMDSAIIGTHDNLVSNYLDNAGGNKVKAALRRAFPSYEDMKYEYKATRLTLPYWYVYRLIKARKKAVQELNKLKDL